MGPVIAVTRQRQPGILRVHRPLLAEAAVFVVDGNIEQAGPGAQEFARPDGAAVEIEGTVAVLLVVQHPCLPALQFVGHEYPGGLRGNGQ